MSPQSKDAIGTTLSVFVLGQSLFLLLEISESFENLLKTLVSPQHFSFSQTSTRDTINSMFSIFQL